MNPVFQTMQFESWSHLKPIIAIKYSLENAWRDPHITPSSRDLKLLFENNISRILLTNMFLDDDFLLINISGKHPVAAGGLVDVVEVVEAIGAEVLHEHVPYLGWEYRIQAA